MTTISTNYASNLYKLDNRAGAQKLPVTRSHNTRYVRDGTTRSNKSVATVRTSSSVGSSGSSVVKKEKSSHAGRSSKGGTSDPKPKVASFKSKKSESVSSKSKAVSSKTKAASSKTKAVSSKTKAVSSKTKAVSSKTKGVSSKSKGVSSKSVSSKTKAASSKPTTDSASEQKTQRIHVKAGVYLIAEKYTGKKITYREIDFAGRVKPIFVPSWFRDEYRNVGGSEDESDDDDMHFRRQGRSSTDLESESKSFNSSSPHRFSRRPLGISGVKRSRSRSSPREGSSKRPSPNHRRSPPYAPSSSHSYRRSPWRATPPRHPHGGGGSRSHHGRYSHDRRGNGDRQHRERYPQLCPQLMTLGYCSSLPRCPFVHPAGR